MISVRSHAGAPHAVSCQRVVLAGEVSEGQEWHAAFGQGWVFRVLPIVPGKGGPGASYSGWDLIVDREQPTGFPDALLVATPPYNSINEHEVGTTFGLRAQDAIGWNPRSFRFLTDPDAFRESQHLYRQLGQVRMGSAGHASENTPEARATRRLMELERQSSAGEFHIVDARLAPGIADAAPYAENWALAASRTPHAFEPAAQGKSTPLGELRWIRFSITLWLPGAWNFPRELHAERTACGE
ncbi:MAG: hypothetical protein ABSE87_01315 [Terracidiphilus sp.]